MMASGLAEIVDSACPASKPTVLIISACYSGSLIPTLSGPNRMIITAARSDRSSFGCQEENEFTFFDKKITPSFYALRSNEPLQSDSSESIADLFHQCFSTYG